METSPAAKSLAFAFACLILAPWELLAQSAPEGACQRPSVGSAVPEPEDLRSRNGELRVDLEIHNYTEADGSVTYCYTTADGKQAPNLRVNLGDLLILNLKNGLTDPGKGGGAPGHRHTQTGVKENNDPCVSGLMTMTSTNLHFHRLTIPAACH